MLKCKTFKSGTILSDNPKSASEKFNEWAEVHSGQITDVKYQVSDGREYIAVFYNELIVEET